mmetsp:Transcript_2658/g.8633  ORF Transcript_2658/g.8633 Transcript_2658/m.8633 type:complete len:217 (-) Transcript_2658:4876-5526(-)
MTCNACTDKDEYGYESHHVPCTQVSFTGRTCTTDIPVAAAKSTMCCKSIKSPHPTDCSVRVANTGNAMPAPRQASAYSKTPSRLNTYVSPAASTSSLFTVHEHSRTPCASCTTSSSSPPPDPEEIKYEYSNGASFASTSNSIHHASLSALRPNPSDFVASPAPSAGQDPRMRTRRSPVTRGARISNLALITRVGADAVPARDAKKCHSARSGTMCS